MTTDVINLIWLFGSGPRKKPHSNKNQRGL
jgi:hypothetical protein